MPNYVRNIFIEVSDTNKFNKLVVNKKGDVDFNKLIPMPVTLSCGNTTLSFTPPRQYLEENTFTKYAMNTKNFKQYREMIYDTIKFKVPELRSQRKLHSILDREVQKTVEAIYTTWNIVKYGYPSWYEWSRAEWGTKWNACNIDKPYPGLAKQYVFDTAWTKPTIWLSNLAKQLDFILLYADEDIGSNCGIVSAKNGFMSYYTEETNSDLSIVFASVVNGYDLSNYTEDSNDSVDWKYLYENRAMLLEEYFRVTNCSGIYNKHKSILESWL